MMFKKCQDTLEIEECVAMEIVFSDSGFKGLVRAQEMVLRYNMIKLRRSWRIIINAM